MKLAYVTVYDATEVQHWSGSGKYVARSLEDTSTSLQYVGSLTEEVSAILKVKRRFYRHLLKKQYLFERDPGVLKAYARQVSNELNRVNPDIIFSPGTIPIAYLDCQQPSVFWTDCTFGSMIDFYPEFTNLCQESINHGNQMEKAALDRCKLAIYTSDWAAQSAIELYQVPPHKVKVVPFGANLDRDHSLEEIKDLLESRPSNLCKLLFLGVDWERKGGNVALEVAKELNKTGLRTELTIVGCNPPVHEPLPDFVRSLGFISKSTPEGKQKIEQLIAESHFLIVPSVAECYGIVFCEANSLGVPCLSTNVGGIPTIIRTGKNGKTFDRAANAAEYCTYIHELFSDYAKYKSLALSSLQEYKSRLNWQVAGQTVRTMLKELV